MARFSSFRRRNRCWTLTLPSLYFYWWTASLSRRRFGHDWWMRLRAATGRQERSSSKSSPRDGGHPQQLRFSQRFECKRCNLRYEEPEPRLFSFNNPYGACPRCQGFGNTIDFDMGRVVPDASKTLDEGAIEPWTKPKYKPLFTEMKRFARSGGNPTRCGVGESRARTAASGGRRRRKISRRSRLLRASGTQEVQAARAGFS